MTNVGAKWAIDPTAGVRLMPGLVYCPRCGIAKGRVAKVRRGLCGDCRESLTREERIAWTA